MSTAAVLVVGGGGLLGSAVRRAAEHRGARTVRPTVPWSSATDAVDHLVLAMHAIDAEFPGDWSLAWCAGAGVVGATSSVLEDEVAILRGLVDRLLADGAVRPRAVFFASSAGAVYGGSERPPFTEHSVPVPLGAYGRAKLRAEAEIGRLGTVSRVAIGRISNLYGPGQDLAKNQGLISRLCLSDLLHEPVGVYVSLDTLRDYIYVEDCAAMICDVLDRVQDDPDADGRPVVKILASQQPASIAHLLGECRRVFGRKVLVRMASSPLATQQARDLRLRSVVWPELDRRSTTTLVSGIHATSQSLLAGLGEYARARDAR